jgi:predicted DNA-binding transcriptional regulator AlpA
VLYHLMRKVRGVKSAISAKSRADNRPYPQPPASGDRRSAWYLNRCNLLREDRSRHNEGVAALRSRSAPIVDVHPAPAEPTGPRLISTAQLLVMLGISIGSLDNLRRREDFPKPYRFSATGKLSWDGREIEKWLEAQRVAGDASNV